MLKSNYLIILLLSLLSFSESIQNNTSKNVFIIVGGYNAANNGEFGNNHRVFPGVMVWNSNINQWTEARYPLPGADSKDSSGGSIWGWFGNGLYNVTKKPTYLIDIARSDSNILDWVPTYTLTPDNITNIENNFGKDYQVGKYYPLLSNAIDIAFNNTLAPIILWQEGESDATGGLFDSIINYKYYLSKLVESTHHSISWGIAISAYSPDNYIRRQQYIRDSQRSVISKYFNRTYAGPKSDVLCTKYRYNKYYFNIEGLQMLGRYWVNSTLNRTKLSHLQGDICDVYDESLMSFFVWASYTLLFFLACIMAIMISWYISGRMNSWFVSIPYRRPTEANRPLINRPTVVYPPKYVENEDFSVQKENISVQN